MKIITKKFYKCEKCNVEYTTLKEVISCENKPITKDKGVKIGDIVLIIGGECKGKKSESN